MQWFHWSARFRLNMPEVALELKRVWHPWPRHSVLLAARLSCAPGGKALCTWCSAAQASKTMLSLLCWKTWLGFGRPYTGLVGRSESAQRGLLAWQQNCSRRRHATESEGVQLRRHDRLQRVSGDFQLIFFLPKCCRIVQFDFFCIAPVCRTNFCRCGRSCAQMLDFYHWKNENACLKYVVRCEKIEKCAICT